MPRPVQERLAFSTNAFKKTTLEQALRSIAELGYAGCELMADHPHMTPLTMSESEMRQLRRVIDGHGLGVSNVNAFTGFFAANPATTSSAVSPPGEAMTPPAGDVVASVGDTYHPTWIENDPAARQVRIDHTIACARLAAAVGAKTLSLQPGGPLIGTGLSRDQAGGRFAAGIREVLPVARELGVTFAIEPEPGLFLQTTAEFRQWKREFFEEEPLVKMNFDVGHAFCVGEAPAIVAREMAGEYVHVHLEDIAASRVHQHLAPGEGAIDFRALFQALEEAEYDGWITVELYPFLYDAAGVARRAIKHLRKIH